MSINLNYMYDEWENSLKLTRSRKEMVVCVELPFT